MCRFPQIPKTWSSGARVTSSCELTNLSVTEELGSSVRAVYILNHWAIFPGQPGLHSETLSWKTKTNTELGAGYDATYL